MNFNFSERELYLREQAGALARSLTSYEVELDRDDTLSASSRKEIHQLVQASGLAAMNMPTAWGGAGLNLFEQVLVMEQLGRLSNSLWTLVWHPANVLAHGTDEQRERYLQPAIRGELVDCVSITESGAGSDVRGITTSAIETGEGYRIRGEKWLASGSEDADFIVLLAKVQPGEKYTLFLIDSDLPGRTVNYSPRLSASGPNTSPQVVYHDVLVPKNAVLGQVGEGLDLAKEWFVDERLYIAARCVGGPSRALELATEWAQSRVQFGTALIEHQLVQAALADSIADVALARALTYQVASEVVAQVYDRKTMHAKAAVVKFAASEAAGRVLDRCVQLFGGRGQMRDNAVERLARSLRVERIWDGPNDIQRLIVGNHVKKRGLLGLL